MVTPNEFKEVKAKQNSISVGLNEGPVVNDRKRIAGNSFNNLEVTGNVVINNSPETRTPIIVASTIVIGIVLLGIFTLIGIHLWKNGSKSPGAAPVILEKNTADLPSGVRKKEASAGERKPRIQLGARGGFFYVNPKNGRKVYLAREEGEMRYKEQQNLYKTTEPEKQQTPPEQAQK